MSANTGTAFDSEAYVIEIEDIPAGIAFRERGGYRFTAIDRRFRLLDGSRFRHLRQLEAAARNLYRAQSR